MKNRVSAFVFLTCFFLSLTTHAAADGLEHLWSRGFSSGGVTGAAIDASGRVLVMGDFDTPTINIGGDDLARVGEWDIFLGAFDANGVHVWSRSAGGTAWDRGGRIAADAWGNVIVTGFFEETANFGGEDIVSAGARDIVLAKYGPDGAHLWSVGLGGTQSESGSDVAVDPNGDIVLAYAAPIYPNTFYTIARFDGAGSPMWEFEPGWYTSGDLVVNPAGVIAVTGSALQPPMDPCQYPVDSKDVLVASLDEDGNESWSGQFGDSCEDEGRTIAIDSDGNVIVAGLFWGTVDFGGGDLVSAGFGDVFVAKYSATGTHQWSRRFGHWADGEWADAIAVDGAGNIYVGGSFITSISIGDDTFTGLGSNDIFVTKLDPGGDIIWARHFGSGAYDVLSDIVVRDNIVLLSGYTSQPSNFGGDDIQGGFIAKFMDSGVVPVLFKEFTATQRGPSVELSWALTSDEAMDRYTIYRSEDGRGVEIATGDANEDRVFIDDTVEPGRTYDYELVVRTTRGVDFRSPVASVSVAGLATRLGRNYPNPFNPTTRIEYTLGEASHVVVEIFDASGALVARLDDGWREPGSYSVSWHALDMQGRPVASGLYFYRLAGAGQTPARKMVLIK